MSSIGKITSSLLSIPAELTVAAANLNFDFSLVKVEAPKEFHGVRDALSQIRRDKAESGLPHITARKLGALFEPLVPPIPNLLSAYGQRVSEISAKISGEGSHLSSAGFGIFSSQAGPDATNIWAAATSGRGAMAVQLLACMLARIWSEPQAISLWVELVERRRNQVNVSTVDGSNVATLMAAQQTFSRDQLAAWDSSARSWIKTADGEKRVQQTQLMLIISNMELPVNSSNDLYESVIKAWTSAMIAMEKLTQGIPQQIRDGSILLAISSWHLYPDMAVLSDVMTPVRQHDPLMNRSLLTFSVHISSTKEESNGVFWSLPMAHMRYYSPPVVAQGRLTSDTSRITMDEFLIVVLGMVISSWIRVFCPDVSRCCRLIRDIWYLVKDLPPDQNRPRLNSLSMLSGAAEHYLNATGILSQQYYKLIALGIRSQSEFARGNVIKAEPAFGLTSFGIILSLVRDEMQEEKIKYLRHIAQSLKADSEDVVITYIPRNQAVKETARTGSRGSRPMTAKLREDIYRQARSKEVRLWLQSGRGEKYVKIAFDAHSHEYASAFPHRWSTQKRTTDDTAPAGEGHCRWVIGKRDPKVDKTWIRCPGNDCGCLSPYGPRCICVGSCSEACHPGTLKCRMFMPLHEFPTKTLAHSKTRLCEENCIICYNCAQKSGIEAVGEELRWYGEGDISHSNGYFSWKIMQRYTSYAFVLGDADSCGIFKSENCKIGRAPSPFAAGYTATIEEVEAILRSPIIASDLLYASLRKWFHESATKDFFTAMVFATDLYQGLPDATVSLEVLKIPLSGAAWYHQAVTNHVDLPTIFSCLAMFESGQFVIDTASLKGVMAMSSYDSIFVASALMTDPWEDNTERPIKRVFGNMGRSEMAFMIPPTDPRFKDADPGSWHLINHASFDGQFLDSFKSTSLHLSLTDFELFLDVGARGLRDRQAVVLESVITVNDKGVDLGDLDILSIFDSDLVVRAGPCAHGFKAKEYQNDSSSPVVNCDDALEMPQCLPASSTGLISLDCWDELLDPPANSKSIFRATGNWQARLAATAACRQRGYRVRVLPKKSCVLCIGSAEELDEFDVLIA